MTDPRKPEIDPDKMDDLPFFRHLEETFIGLRGAPLLLSPSDWDTARSWRSDGIPFDLIEGVLREVFERAPEKSGRGGIRSLKYFDSPVRKAWEETKALGLGAITRDVDDLDIDGRLKALAAALPEGLPGILQIRDRILALRGTPEAVEGSLARLDDEMISMVRANLGPDDRVRIENETTVAVARITTRVDGEGSEEIRHQLEIRQLRRQWGLPVLSLFSVSSS
jgi:hypothetical protein